MSHKIYIPYAGFTSLRHFLIKMDKKRPHRRHRGSFLFFAPRNFDAVDSFGPRKMPRVHISFRVAICRPGEKWIGFSHRFATRWKKRFDSTNVISRFRRIRFEACNWRVENFPGKITGIGGLLPRRVRRRKISRYRTANNIPDIPGFRSHVANTIP